MRKIIHMDMDAFFASVEQRDRPELKGRPVIVGGRPGTRGVVATCSYEARRFGIHSAMASNTASRLCPQAIFVEPRFEVYRTVSSQIMSIFREYSDLIEPLSLDEAFIDVTNNKKNIPSATIIAKDIRKRVREETRLCVSAGVSYNKFLAKVASDYNKPDGLTVITPENAQEFIDRLPIGKFFGIGKVTEKKMREMDIRNGADLRAVPEEKLVRAFGKAGRYFYDIARGNDEREVTPFRVRKSIGKEITLLTDTDDMNEIISILSELADQVEDLLKLRKTKGSTITLKIKYHDFESISRSVTVMRPVDEATEIMTPVKKLLGKTLAGTKKIRLLGITVSRLSAIDDSAQLILPIF